jgi:uncharacterized protein YidB (DUF937 family)
MGILDSLEQAAGLAGPAPGTAATAPQGAVGAVLEMLQSQPGGVMGIVQQFERAGLGGVAQSWLCAGQNQVVTGEQVQSALGVEPVAQVTAQLGIPQHQAAGHIAQFLPLILDALSPGGQPPQDGGLGGLEGLISRLATH